MRLPLRLPVRVLLRQVWADRWGALLLVVLVASSTGLVLGVLRTVDTVTTVAVRQSVAATGSGVRDLVGAMTLPVLTGDAGHPAAAYDHLADQVDDTLRPLQPLVGPATWQVGMPTMESVDPQPRPGPVRRMALRVDSRWTVTTRLVAGRAPASGQPSVPAPDATPDAPPTPAVIEVALSRFAADVMLLQVGDVVHGVTSAPDGRIPAIDLRVVGLFEALDPRDQAWTTEPSTLHPRRQVSDVLGPIYTGVAYAGAGALPVLAGETQGSVTTVTVRSRVDGSHLLPEQAQTLLPVIGRVSARGVTIADAGGAIMFMNTDLDVVLRTFLRQRVPLAVLAAVLLVSMAGSALVVLLLAVRLLVDRRRAALLLATARGASPTQLLGVLAAEGLLLATPAALAGVLLAAGVPGRAGAWAVAVPVAAAVLPALALPALALPVLRSVRPAGRPDAAPVAGGGILRGARRDLTRRGFQAGQLLLLGVVVAGVLALRRRGIAVTHTSATGAEVPHVDPLVVLVPVLVAVTAALVAVRLAAPVVSRASRWWGRRRSAVGFLGITRAAREGLGAVAVVALVLGMAVTVLACVTGTTVTTSAERAAAQAAGADLRLIGSFTPQEAHDVARLPGVSAVTELATLESSLVRLHEPGETAQVSVEAVDPLAMTRVQAGLQGAPGLGADVAAALTRGTGSPGSPLPVAVSPGIRVDGVGLGVGQRLTLTVRHRAIAAQVVAVLPQVAGLPQDEPWALAAIGPLRERTALVVPAQSLLVRAAQPPTRDAVRSAAADVRGYWTPSILVARVTSSELPRAMRSALPVAVAVGAGYAAAAVVLTLLVGAGARTRLLAHLRAMGLSMRQAAALVAWEVVPIAVVAAATGLGVGLWIARLVLPAADLRPLTGAVFIPPVSLAWAQLALLVLGYACVVAAAVGVGAVAGRAVSPAEAARTAEAG